ncbi:MAG: ABC transporter substrate-binding protein [Candidatus Nanopelagicales bacterium]
MKVRRKTRLRAVAAVCAVGAVLLAGCGDAVGGSKSGSGILVVGADAGSSNQFPENFNVNGGGAAAPGVGLFYETLFRVSSVNGGALVPNLATSVDFAEDGYTATYHLREGVKWNDGEPFTAKDVAFSYNLVFGDAGEPDPDDPSKSPSLREPVTAVDDLTVKMRANFALFQQDTNMSLYYPIYPEHIYGKQADPSKFVDADPVGTGPGKLKSFSGQRIDVTIRDDYWGGPSKGVKEVQIIPAGTVGNIQSSIGRGTVDWSEGTFPGVLTQFVGKEPENRYDYFPDGSSRGVVFATEKMPFSDVAVRRALRDSVDLTSATAAAGIGYTVPTAAGLSTRFFRGLLAADYSEPLAPDVERAKKELADAGWTVEKGNLVKNGKSYPMKLHVNLGQNLDILVAPMIVDQWKKNLGLEVDYTPTSDTVFQAKYPDYQMFLWNTNLSGSPYNAFQAYSHANLSAERQKMDYGNRGLWRASDAFEAARVALAKVSPTDPDAVRPLFETLQTEVGAQAPYLAAIEGGSGAMWTVKNWTGWPDPDTSDYRPSVAQLNNITQTVMNLEPAS